MEMALLVVGIGAAAVWFFMSKDKPRGGNHPYDHP
jgi:hypothetical protein